MNQMTSGQTNLEEQLDTILNEYESSQGIKFPQFTQDTSIYWNMSRDYIEALSKEERESIAMLLAQQALYIQRLINRERARVSFCNHSLSSVCVAEYVNYKHIFKDEDKVMAIAKENGLAMKILKIKNHAEIRLLDLQGLPPIINHLSEILIRSSYGKEKRAGRYSEND